MVYIFLGTLDVLSPGMLAFSEDLEMKWFCWSDQAGVSCGNRLSERGPRFQEKGDTGKFYCFSAQTIEQFDSSQSQRLGDLSVVFAAGPSAL